MKIIAELGSNFRDFKDLKNAIHLAKEAGADAIKYQYFCEHDLYGHGSIEYNFEGSLIPALVEECKRLDIEFMCTIFNHELVELFDQHIKTWKIASSDMCYVDLLKEINKTRKPVYMSTGGHTIAEINHSLTLLSYCVVTVMYCVSTYPANHISFDEIGLFHGEFPHLYPIGLSDHSTDVFTIPTQAKDYDCEALEKHFNPYDLQTSDSPHSLSFDDFRDMVRHIKGKYKSKFPKPCERHMLLRNNRRHVAIKTIRKGDTFKLWDNIGLYRTKQDDMLGMHAFANLDGKISKRDYATGKGVWE